MPNHESNTLEPPPRTSIDDPGAHELGMLTSITASLLGNTDIDTGQNRQIQMTISPMLNQEPILLTHQSLSQE